MESKDELISEFVKLFNRSPEVIVRCPGRVNIIGEHIDYHGYGVFPMAIDASTVILAARNDKNTMEFENLDANYESWKCELPCEWNGVSPPKWFDYILCGWKGIMEHEKFEQFGFSILLKGDIPPSSGLSSSSSLVCASALTILSLHHRTPFDFISREDFANLCANSEPLIGTLSGGMDQAAEVLAIDGCALRIEFGPLRSRNINLPRDAVFLVAHSNTVLNKAATSHYNERVVEGRIVGEILKQKLGINSSSFRLKEIQELGGKSFEQLLSIVENEIPEEVTRADAERIIGKENFTRCLSNNTKHLETFKLRSRARHVFSEARRVDQFESACESADLQLMGELMNQSHASCAIDYECSCVELDEICQRYLEAGAIGARLTGAGWGGCAVILCRSQDIHKLIALNPLFVSRPAAGICVEHI